MGKILVLGGTGAMGAHLVQILSSTNDCYISSRKHHIKDDTSSVHYILGNAHDLTFLSKVLREGWDAIIDFMLYSTQEFESKLNLFLTHTKQYVFISSSRVYDNFEGLIIEESNRLLDTCKDLQYLQSDEYALAKARQENLLLNSGCDNWTIIRPYVTYSENRFQLGPLEKEYWLYRAINNKPIVFSRDISDKYTTLTYGKDVAKGIASIVGVKEAYGNVFHITHPSSLKWKDVVEIYSMTLSKLLKRKVTIQYIDAWEPSLGGSKYQVLYDRLYDRKFDNSKISRFVDLSSFVHPAIGLELCLKEFVANPVFLPVSYKSEAFKDRISYCHSSISSIPGIKNKLKYLYERYL